MATVLYIVGHGFIYIVGHGFIYIVGHGFIYIVGHGLLVWFVNELICGWSVSLEFGKVGWCVIKVDLLVSC